MSNPKKKDLPEKSESFMEGVKTYLKGVRSEWGKITWPERSQVFRETFAVLFVVFLFTVLVYILDIIFSGLLGLIPNR